MTLTLNLSAEAERTLRERADQTGESVEGYVTRLLEKEARNGGPPPKPATWQELSAPIAEALEAGGMTEDEFATFVEELRDEVWQEQQAKSSKNL